MNDAKTAPKYVVGIDLGTTHTALAYAEIPTSEDAKTQPAKMLAIPQLVAHGTIDARELLPSFFYVAHESDGPQVLPWDDQRKYAVGEHARARGVDAPARVISSAKSWLCHPSVDRRSAILPPGAPEDVERISPVEASWRYLEHLVEAWDYVVAKGDPELALTKQAVVLTVPASFDAAARELTTEAAYAAGFEDLTLLEEPQAAFYAWLADKGEAWRKDVQAGDVVLVVDVGGGTSDFSVIAAVDKGGELTLERVAVGDHILLGGDNMEPSARARRRTEDAPRGRRRRQDAGARPLAKDLAPARGARREREAPHELHGRIIEKRFCTDRDRWQRLEAHRRHAPHGGHARRGPGKRSSTASSRSSKPRPGQRSGRAPRSRKSAYPTRRTRR